MINASTTNQNRMPASSVFLKRTVTSVLLIGNNPIELTSLFEMLNSRRKSNYLAEVCFDVRDSFSLITRINPDVILLDDNLDSDDTAHFMKVLRSNSKTRNVKVILLKSSNWNLHVFDHMDDYVLKDTIHSELIDRLIVRNLKDKKVYIA
jgi:CheY-like chemotaxis protein